MIVECSIWSYFTIVVIFLLYSNLLNFKLVKRSVQMSVNLMLYEKIEFIIVKFY